MNAKSRAGVFSLIKDSPFLQLVLCFFLATFVYIDLPRTFFQQDEWQFFGAAITALSLPNPIIETLLPFGGELTHFYPLAKLFFLVEYILFKVNFTPYALVSFAFHIANSLLVYRLMQKLTKKDLLALLGTGLFVVNSFSHQAVTWVLAGIIALPSTFFLLLSLIYFLEYLERRKTKIFLLLLLSLIASLLFKEISIFMFAFVPIWWVIHNARRKLPIIPKRNLLLLLFGVGGLYLALRIFFLVFQVRSEQPEIVDVRVAPLGSYLYRIISVPLKGVAQSFFPQGFLINLSDSLTHLAYPQFINTDGAANQHIVQSIGFDLVSYTLAIIVFILVFFVYQSLSKTAARLKYALLFSFLFAVASFLPFIFVPGKAGYFSIFEPRNLYVASIGTSLLIVISAWSLGNILAERPRIATTLFIVVLLPILLMHVKKLRSDLDSLERIGQIRESFLTTLAREYPALPKVLVIYTMSDRSYYGMPPNEKILPIQTGFGRMAMVWYHDRERFPACLYKDQFLLDLLSEGYKYCDGRGFGYFRSYDKLANAVKSSNVTSQDVIAYEWDGGTERFTDITFQTRERIRKEEGQ